MSSWKCLNCTSICIIKLFFLSNFAISYFTASFTLHSSDMSTNDTLILNNFISKIDVSENIIYLSHIFESNRWKALLISVFTTSLPCQVSIHIWIQIWIFKFSSTEGMTTRPNFYIKLKLETGFTNFLVNI